MFLKKENCDIYNFVNMEKSDIILYLMRMVIEICCLIVYDKRW